MAYNYILISILFFFSLYLVLQAKNGNIKIQNSSSSVEITNYEGEYTSKRNMIYQGIISFQITQTGSKIAGEVICKVSDQENNINTLLVEGHVRYGIAYIRFRDTQNEIITQGVLNRKNNNIIFNQTNISDILPKYAVLYKQFT
ncbi:hypothetical protein OZ668_15265 [Elizabethkingia sp. HX XZB]|uniref:hypothetical protein n=1 Tax=Elizabethkingia sp. HX XZB TaxID=3003193 RepID=UPI002A24EF94|nr:hypothetical protein [Elizabethkingia sp. HX XZB]MDX8569359.1 hypothetical protein [Elizabethkingia sp. HX XZB]